MKNKSKKTAKQTAALNSESTTVLKVIVKTPGIHATGIKKSLKWNFVPSRALSTLLNRGFIKMAEDKGYSVTAAGRKALTKV